MMTPRTMLTLCAGLGTACLLSAALTSQAEQLDQADSMVPAAEQPEIDKHRVPLAVARDRAALMHDIYESTLHAMHHHYFRSGKAVLPARALEDVFEEMADNSKMEARWISVNTRAMSVDHEPDSEFEKQAASEIAKGAEHLEIVEGGFYRRATPIPLGAGCVSCHTGLLTPPPKTPRFAGLVISIPVKDE